MANPTRKGPHCCAHTTARSNSSIVSDVLSATRQRNTNCTKPQLHLANKIPKNTACLKSPRKQSCKIQNFAGNREKTKQNAKNSSKITATMEAHDAK